MEAMSRRACEELLASEPIGHIGIIDGGEPYVTPISFVLIDGELRFRTGPGRRLEALEANPRACVEVSRQDPQRGTWDSVIVWGDARRIRDRGAEERTVEALLAKYRDAIPSVLAFSSPQALPASAVVVAVPLEVVSGRSSGRGFDPRLRPGRL